MSQVSRNADTFRLPTSTPSDSQSTFQLEFNNKSEPFFHTTFNDYYGGIKSEHLVLCASTFAQKAALLEVTSAAQTKFKMKGCLVEEYDPSTATATSLIKRIKFLAMTKSPRGQGFRTIAFAPPPSATGLAITNKIAALSAADLKDDCDAGKVLYALGEAVVTGGRVDLPSSGLLEGDGMAALGTIQHATYSAVALSADIVSTVTGKYSAGPYTAFQASWSADGE